MVLRVIYVRLKGSMTPLALPGDNKLAEKHAKKAKYAQLRHVLDIVWNWIYPYLREVQIIQINQTF